MSNSDFYIFREGRRNVGGEQSLQSLRECLARAADGPGWIDALLRSGELECALEDANSPFAATLTRITDCCASAVVDANYARQAELAAHLPHALPIELTVSAPEGFAYYALHPMQYANVVRRIHAGRRAVVIGIRSIGTTLSAVTAAALRGRGIEAQRFSVRPEGHPFDRAVHWSSAQRQTIAGAMEAGATFLIVDEGPGLSGSSFLSVAEALVAAGVSPDTIVLVPSYVPQVEKLRGRDAAQRWKQFHCVPIEDGQRPEEEWIGAGLWRNRFLGKESEWPGVWTTMERAKFLSRDLRIFWKYEGLGPYGERARGEAYELADAGFSPRVLHEESGFLGYEFLDGAVVSRGELQDPLLRQMAAYCAFRAAHFAAEVSETQLGELETMLRVNFEREFQAPLSETFAKLALVRPVICDARMMPQEWIRSDSRLFKVDAVSHGDDHFFPGPCDIAWDLAGAIVEWEMDESGREEFLRQYRELSGDNASARIENYLLAYTVFHFSWSKMAAAAMQGTPEEVRLLRDYQRYRALGERIALASARS